MSFVENLKSGVIALQLIIIAYQWFAPGRGDLAQLGTIIIGGAAVFFVAKYFFEWLQFKDLYKVARFTVPGYEKEHYSSAVNFREVRMQYFKGYYLIS